MLPGLHNHYTGLSDHPGLHRCANNDHRLSDAAAPAAAATATTANATSAAATAAADLPDDCLPVYPCWFPNYPGRLHYWLGFLEHHLSSLILHST